MFEVCDAVFCVLAEEGAWEDFEVCADVVVDGRLGVPGVEVGLGGGCGRE